MSSESCASIALDRMMPRKIYSQRKVNKRIQLSSLSHIVDKKDSAALRLAAGESLDDFAPVAPAESLPNNNRERTGKQQIPMISNQSSRFGTSFKLHHALA